MSVRLLSGHASAICSSIATTMRHLEIPIMHVLIPMVNLKSNVVVQTTLT